MHEFEARLGESGAERSHLKKGIKVYDPYCRVSCVGKSRRDEVGNRERESDRRRRVEDGFDNVFRSRRTRVDGTFPGEFRSNSFKRKTSSSDD
jgi:hypothetical protein